MYIQKLGKTVPSPCQNTLGVCNQITILILHYISSRLVTFLKSLMPLQKLVIFLDLTVSFKFLNFSFQICLPLFLKCLLASCLTLVRISTLSWLGSCIRCILACFLWSKKLKHSSPNHGLCCFNSSRPRLYLAEVLILTCICLRAGGLSVKFPPTVDVITRMCNT